MNVKCRVCGSNTSPIGIKELLYKYQVNYYKCNECLYVMTEEPYWLEEAYSESINLSDTGYMARNISLSNYISILLFLVFQKTSSFLDFAGGSGVFVRLMRDKGFNFYWQDKYTENFFARGFEWNEQRVSAVTAFEVLEHLVNPLHEFEIFLKATDTMIFSTELYKGQQPDAHWDYLGLDHGQHIGFFHLKTLDYVAKKYGLRLYSFHNIHIFTKNEELTSWKFLLSRWLLKFRFHYLLLRFTESKTLSDNHEMIRRSAQKKLNRV